MRRYEVIVVGAGSAGLVAATTAKRLGATTALVERRKVGGECLHTGCVPSKTFIHSARLFHDMTNAPKYGLPAAPGALDFSRVMARVSQVVEELYRHEDPGVFRDLGIDVYEAEASFTSPETLRIGAEEVAFERALVCTGSSPLVPPIEGLSKLEYLTNENVWALRELPPSLLFIGAGPIAVELGQAFSRFGSKVTMVELMDRVLPNEDEDVSKQMLGQLRREGLAVQLSSKVTRAQPHRGGALMTVEGRPALQTIAASRVFISVGRRPNLGGLELERAGVRHSPLGIEVDGALRTSAPRIWACGDVVGPLRFTHVAAYQADLAIRNALRAEQVEQDLTVVPWVTFCEPECARVGLTEDEARKAHGDVEVLRVAVDSVDRPTTEGKKEGFLKVILDRADRILGAHSVAPHAGEFIHELALAMKHGLGIEAIAKTVHAYPSYAELVRKAAARHLRAREKPGGTPWPWSP